MDWEVRRVGSWVEVLRTLSQIPIQATDGPNYIFRGQSNQEWGLKSSLARMFEDGHTDLQKVVSVESSMLHDFESHMHLDPLLAERIHLAGNRPGMWPLMQHYGCPTRLLDWTESVWVALYFAVVEGRDVDGAVYSFPSSPLNTLSDRRRGDMRKLSFSNAMEATPEVVWPVLQVFHTQRSAAQRGSFTLPTNPLSDHGEVIRRMAEEDGAPPFLKLVIAKECKSECLGQLHNMNLTARTLFPGVDGIGRAAAEGAKLRIWAFSRPRGGESTQS